MRKDLCRFRKAQRKIAKLYNNVVRGQLLQVQLSQMAPPYLHIMLGIVKKHHTLLETDCRALDKQIAEVLVKDRTVKEACPSAFRDYVTGRIKQIEQLEKENMLHETVLSWNEVNEEQSLAS
ncbi:hypothetical protein ACOMHN_047476 [Nucella lapillus]